MTRHDDLPPMVNEDGTAFDDAALAVQDALLRSFSDTERRDYRDRNSDAIATSPLARVLIVAGPGTGKSFLFLTRITDWLKKFPGERIYVSSFVRKLVTDMTNDIETSDLSPAEKALVAVTTLHGLARSLLERNHGTAEQPLKPYIQVITEEWKEAVWGDVLSLHPDVAAPEFKSLERQFHELSLVPDDPWPRLRDSYFRVCRLYNAIGFADSVVLATEALRENPDLNQHSLWIVDEFQDFNASEAQLLWACAEGANGIVLAGDDDQALYRQLKASHPEIIRSEYRNDRTLAKAMLPFCGRCSYHICMGASAFLDRQREPESIRKVYLPASTGSSGIPIQIVACWSPAVAVGYVIEFIEQHRNEIATRREAILLGVAKDPFLLVLSFQRDPSAYFGEDGVRLLDVLSEWKIAAAEPGRDYRRGLTYRALARFPQSSFIARKVLAYEAVEEEHVHELVSTALSLDRSLTEVEDHSITEAIGVAEKVRQSLESDEDPREKAQTIASLIEVDDADSLAADITAFPIEGTASSSMDAEDIETAGRISPADFMTMIGAKGLYLQTM